MVVKHSNHVRFYYMQWVQYGKIHLLKFIEQIYVNDKSNINLSEDLISILKSYYSIVRTRAFIGTPYRYTGTDEQKSVIPC